MSAESYRESDAYKAGKERYDVLARSSYGESLLNRARFDMFMSEGQSVSEWEGILGPDVNNLHHMAYTAAIAVHLEQTRPVNNTPEKQRRKFIAAFLHDMGEARLKDINYFDKKSSDFIAEKAAFKIIVDEIFDAADREEIKRIADDIIFDDNSREGVEFSIVEHAGYLQTGLKTWALLEYDKGKEIPEKVKHRMLGITASTLVSTLDKSYDRYINNVAPEFNRFVEGRLELMVDAFKNMPDQVFDVFGATEEMMRERFAEAKEKWTNIYAANEKLPRIRRLGWGTWNIRI